MEQQYLISIADDPIIIKIQPVISALGWGTASGGVEC